MAKKSFTRNFDSVFLTRNFDSTYKYLFTFLPMRSLHIRSVIESVIDYSYLKPHYRSLYDVLEDVQPDSTLQIGTYDVMGLALAVSLGGEGKFLSIGDIIEKCWRGWRTHLPVIKHMEVEPGNIVDSELGENKYDALIFEDESYLFMLAHEKEFSPDEIYTKLINAVKPGKTLIVVSKPYKIIDKLTIQDDLISREDVTLVTKITGPIKDSYSYVFEKVK